MRIPFRSESARLLLLPSCQSETRFRFSFPSALCLARAQRREAMGDREISSIRLSLFCNKVHLSVCERPQSPAGSAETTNKAAGSRVTNFVRAFILKTFHPSSNKSHVLHDSAILKMCGSRLIRQASFPGGECRSGAATGVVDVSRRAQSLLLSFKPG
jgi:hypothetical protein